METSQNSSCVPSERCIRTAQRGVWCDVGTDRYSTLKLKVSNMSSDDSYLSLSCEMILLVTSGWSNVCTFTGQLRSRKNSRSHYKLFCGHNSKHVVSHISG